MPCVRFVLWILMTGLLAGCAGDGKGLDQNGQPIGAGTSSSSGGSTGGQVTAEFQSIQDNVFTPICSKCHIGASAPEGLQLDAAHSYNLLVGVPSVEQPGLDRVKPGDADHSYMVLKIEGAPSIDGGRMPLGETPLPQATIDAIRAWIANGAMRPSSASLAMAITQAEARTFGVESTTPIDRSVVNAPIGRVVVAFNHEVDAALVNTTTVKLERIDQGDASPVPVEVRLAEHNQAVLLVTPASALGPGVYRLTLRGTGGAALADVDAATLGADPSFTFTAEAAP